MIKKINIKLKNDVLKFDNINLSNLNICPKFVCIAGENGSGKTTLFNSFKSAEKVSNVKLTKSNAIFISHVDVNVKLSQSEVNRGMFTKKTLEDSINYLDLNPDFFHNSETRIDGIAIKRDQLSGNNIIRIMNEIINLQNKIISSENHRIIGLKSTYSKEILYDKFEKNLLNSHLNKFQNIINDYFKNNKIDFNDDKWFNGKYTFDKISSGEQQLLLLSLKIFDELFVLYDQNKLPSAENYIYIFIDEIEAYLHPRWQYIILILLKKVVEIFTNNYQFIFTTHSREIIDFILTNKQTKDCSAVIQLTKSQDNIIKNKIFTSENSLMGGTSEINYNIFNIPTVEYFLSLYEYVRHIRKWRYLEMDEEISKIDGVYKVKIDPDISGRYKKYNGKQTFVSRMRHIIAHGIVGTEDNYKWYLDNKSNPKAKIDKYTSDFYNAWENNDKMELLNQGITILLKLINSAK